MSLLDDGSWRTPTFRQSVVAKIDETIRTSAPQINKNSMEIENYIFQKAKSKEEYLGFVARLILHVREMDKSPLVPCDHQAEQNGKMTGLDDGLWRTPTFRQGVVAKIDEAVRTFAPQITKSSLEIENYIFQKAKSKEEYLEFAARLILHMQEMDSKKGGGIGVPGGGPGNQAAQDPIGALQNLARQVSRLTFHEQKNEE